MTMETGRSEKVANRTPESFTIDRLQAFAVSAHPKSGPVSSLGPMPVRNALLVAITTKDGATGWGEVWCNFPPRGNLSRLNLLEDVIAPVLIGKCFDSYTDCRPMLETAQKRMSIHTGEAGPFNHCVAGIDCALADVAAKTAGLSLSEFLHNHPLSAVPVYASTPNVTDLERSITQIMESGHTGIKLKLGHGVQTDSQLLKNTSAITGKQLQIYIDANQNWTVEEATLTMETLTDYSIGFVEEPLMADAPYSDWATLSNRLNVPLAAGENIYGTQNFRNFAEHGKVQVLQPDVAKWGGVSGAIEVGQLARENGITCTLHYMGSALGLAISIHTLAAMTEHGAVELDANPNPLRTELGELNLRVTDGHVEVPQCIGHGFLPNPAALKSMTVGSFDLS